MTLIDPYIDIATHNQALQQKLDSLFPVLSLQSVAVKFC